MFILFLTSLIKNLLLITAFAHYYLKVSLPTMQFIGGGGGGRKHYGGLGAKPPRKIFGDHALQTLGKHGQRPF